jgi:hypothetical protein
MKRILLSIFINCIVMVIPIQASLNLTGSSLNHTSNYAFVGSMPDDYTFYIANNFTHKSLHHSLTNQIEVILYEYDPSSSSTTMTTNLPSSMSPFELPSEVELGDVASTLPQYFIWASCKNESLTDFSHWTLNDSYLSSDPTININIVGNNGPVFNLADWETLNVYPIYAPYFIGIEDWENLECYTDYGSEDFGDGYDEVCLPTYQYFSFDDFHLKAHYNKPGHHRVRLEVIGSGEVLPSFSHLGENYDYFLIGSNITFTIPNPYSFEINTETNQLFYNDSLSHLGWINYDPWMTGTIISNVISHTVNESIFLGWHQDYVGNFYDNELTIVVTENTHLIATFSNTVNTSSSVLYSDFDGDGLSNKSEILLGLDPLIFDTSGKLNFHQDRSILLNQLSNQVSQLVYSNNLYQSERMTLTEAQDAMRDLRVGSQTFGVSNGNAKIRMYVDESSDLTSTWSNTQHVLELDIPADTDTKFYRFRMD